MFYREMKINLKSCMIWTSILVGLFLVVFALYPSLASGENSKMLEEMITMFPEELLKVFNMDITGIGTAFGWLQSEGYVFVLLISGVYAGILGSNILLKEESDKTIEYLNSLPVTRFEIVKSRIFTGIIYIFLMTFLVTLFNYIGLTLSGDFDQSLFFHLSGAPFFSSIVIFALTLFISTFFHKTKKTIGISLGVVFASYFLQVISAMGTNVEFLKYFSAFTLADIRNVLLNGTINPIMIVISIGITTLFFILTTIRYKKKELIS